MTLPLDINAIFDIKEEDMVISNGSDHELDNMLDSILYVIDGAGQTWETQDDNNTTINKLETKIGSEYLEWIKNLEKVELSYYKHNHWVHEDSTKKILIV
ncbi:hypothetical protein F8M41_019178 [Gigaspora margarita]|uniref:Uncharacterized protein n=1 Tax=Gigaspora margarita TaxID=4874 RepID=A0A8H4B2F2_GIGMA|nr:hypothetical protein F8M41_019178 [Gigaspora margarita]